MTAGEGGWPCIRMGGREILVLDIDLDSATINTPKRPLRRVVNYSWTNTNL